MNWKSVLAFHVWIIIGLYPFTRVSDAFTRVSLGIFDLAQ